MLKKDYIWNHVTCCKNGKYLASIIDDSVITCDEILDAEAKFQDEETETIPTKFNGKNIAIKAKKKKKNCTHSFINYQFILDSCYCLLLCG